MGLGDRVLEKFGEIVDSDFIDEEGEMHYKGDLVMPKDVDGCTYCGYIGRGWKEHICPKCNKVNQLYKKYIQQQEESKREGKINKRNESAVMHINNQISEFSIATKYRNEGYKVVQTAIYDYTIGKVIPNVDRISDFLKDYPQEDEIINLIKSIGVGLPDLIRLKDDKISFVEVKSNKSNFSLVQKKAIDRLKNEGYEVFAERVPCEYKVGESKIIQPEELKKVSSYNGEFYSELDYSKKDGKTHLQ